MDRSIKSWILDAKGINGGRKYVWNKKGKHNGSKQLVIFFLDKFHVKNKYFFVPHSSGFSETKHYWGITHLKDKTHIKNVSFSKFLKHNSQQHDSLTSFKSLLFKLQIFTARKRNFRGFSGERKIGELSKNSKKNIGILFSTTPHFPSVSIRFLTVKGRNLFQTLPIFQILSL